MPDDFLASMAIASRSRADSAMATTSADALSAHINTLPAPRVPAWRDFDVIAEIKRISPAAGPLGKEDDIVTRARTYEAAGAAVISVLTEPDRFGGSAEDLRVIAGSVTIPVMRKDFLVDPYQILEARAWGASGVLLIAKILDDSLLRAMLRAAQDLGMFALVEAFDREDIALIRGALPADSEDLGKILVGLNCRDLRTLDIRPERFAELCDDFPDGVRRVAESGMESAETVGSVARLGYSVALVGTALMRSDDPGTLVRSMVDAGRGAVR